MAAALLLIMATALWTSACDNGRSPTAPEIPTVNDSATSATASGESSAEQQPAEGEEESTAVSDEARVARTTICHLTGNGGFRLISVAPPALPAHMAHGDAMPGTNGLDDNCASTGPGATPTATQIPGSGTATPTQTAVGTNTATPTSVPSTEVTNTATPTSVPSTEVTNTATPTPVTSTVATSTATPTASGGAAGQVRLRGTRVLEP